MLRKLLILLFITLSTLHSAEEKKESKFKFGFSHRIRFVSWDNTVNLKENSKSFSFTRHRTSFNFNYSFSKKTSVFFKLTNEFRNYLSPKDRKFDFNEVFIDNLYVDIQDVMNLPLNLRIGRQNLIFGEGFLVMEGQPLTGSRSIYFDALRAEWNFNKNKKLTFFAGYVPEYDSYSPIMNKKNQPLNEQAQLATGLYYTAKKDSFEYDVYFIRKDTKDNNEYPVEKKINTVGFRINTPVSFIKNLHYTLEFAYQDGKLGDEKHQSKGGYTYITYKFPSIKFLDNIKAGFVYLEGDNSATSKNEGWDPLFSRWPKWSESYIYTLIEENGVGYWSNLKNYYLTVNFNITEKYSLEGTFMYLESDKPNINHPFPGGAGKKRGNLYKLMLKMKMNKNLNSHILWEYFDPGNFYRAESKPYNWLRFEFLWKF